MTAMTLIITMFILRSFSSALLFTLLLSCGTETAPENSNQSGNTDAGLSKSLPAIIFLGDSLTAGYYMAPEQAAPALIAEKIKRDGNHYRVINGGRSGDTTAGGLARLGWYLRPEVNPKFMVIELGSNDAMRGHSLDTIEKNLGAIIQKTRAYDPEIKIFLYQMKIFGTMGKKYAGAYEKIFPRVARREKIILLPFPLKGLEGKPELIQKDNLHPNVEGTKIQAKNMYEGLKKHL